MKEGGKGEEKRREEGDKKERKEKEKETRMVKKDISINW